MTSDVDDWLQNFADHYIEATNGDISPPLFTEMLLTARELFIHDAQVPPDLVNPTPIEAARYIDQCDAIKKRFQPHDSLLVFNTTIERIYSALPLPPSARLNTGEKAKTNVPLIQLIDRMDTAIEEIIRILFADDITRRKMFLPTRKAIEKNIEKHGLPSKFKGTNLELINAFLGNTSLRAIFNALTPFTISPDIQFAHTWVVAGSGHGKTTALASMIYDHRAGPANLHRMISGASA